MKKVAGVIFKVVRVVTGFILASGLGYLVACAIPGRPMVPGFALPASLPGLYLLLLPTFVLGLPTYLVLQARMRTTWRVYACSGALLGSGIALALMLPYILSAMLVAVTVQRNLILFGHFIYWAVRGGILITGRFALGGIIAGFVFWAIVRPDRAAGTPH